MRMRTAVLSSGMAVFVAVLPAFPRFSSAATRYVDPRGEDGSRGSTANKPFKTIAAAAELVVKRGYAPPPWQART
jgi:hypothetical protein